jgi:hypothetical protein
MIRYAVTRSQLDGLIDAQSKTWRRRADKRTQAFKTSKKFNEKSSIWSEVKTVFMEVQGSNKCVYCERKFGSVEASTVEHDLEHFRPKANVAAWTLPVGLQGLGIVVTQPGARNSGYYLLPYHPENYSSSCKTCNTIYKLDRFPIAGSYHFLGTEPQALLKEAPLLLFPVGNWDVDPEDVIEFHGYMPQVKVTEPELRNRGLVTIAFFGLDDIDRRSDLFRERAEIIAIMYRFLVDAHDPRARVAERADAQDKIDRWTSAKSRHANCARSFQRLFLQDPAQAKRCYKLADAYWASKS